jgi:hypothetical protein
VPRILPALGGEMETDLKMEDFYLPFNSTKKVLVATITTDGEDGNYQEMIRDILRVFRERSFHEDAIKYCCVFMEEIILIYKVVPLLDISKHLEEN